MLSREGLVCLVLEEETELGLPAVCRCGAPPSPCPQPGGWNYSFSPSLPAPPSQVPSGMRCTVLPLVMPGLLPTRRPSSEASVQLGPRGSLLGHQT